MKQPPNSETQKPRESKEKDMDGANDEESMEGGV